MRKLTKHQKIILEIIKKLYEEGTDIVTNGDIYNFLGGQVSKSSIWEHTKTLEKKGFVKRIKICEGKSKGVKTGIYIKN